MEKYHRNQTDNTDDEETVFFRAAASGKSTDQYDTQQLDVNRIREQQARSGYSQGGYPQQGYHSQNEYAPQGQRPTQGSYGYSPYPQQGQYPPQQRPQGQRPPQQRPQGQRPPQQRPQGQRPPQQRPQGQRPPQQHPQGQRPPQAQHSSQKHSKKRKKSSLLGRIFRFLLVLVIIVFLLYSLIAMIGILGMNRVEAGDRSVTDGSLNASYVKSVLVIGTDTRDIEEERGRSDSMILVSMNAKTHEIYMTSFMRDTYVEIPGQGSGKLNAAYSYGGPELLMDTLEQNFDVQIDDYVMVTFSACAAMIDAVGGVDLEISDREAEAVNEILISEVNELMGDDREDDLLNSGGTLTLDGKQALSYSRIRYVGNADFERTERQRTVMSQVIGKVKSNPLRLFSVCMGAIPKMTTNLSLGALYGYAVTTPFKLATYEMKQQRIPADGTYQGADIGGESVLQIDFDAAKQQLATTVYADGN